MRFNEMVDFMFEAWKANRRNTSFCILGAPGIGKSSVATALAARMTEYVTTHSPMAGPAALEIVDLSSKNPEEISGLPFRRQTNGRDETVYAPLSWLSRLCDESTYGVLCLDDLPAAPPAVQVASRQLTLESRVGEVRLAPGILKMVTGNRREDKSAATTLPAHFRNSVCMLELDTDVETWCDWYGKQPNHSPIIASFLRFKPGLHSKLPKEADALGAYATPRTWAKLGELYDVARVTNTTLAVASGLVGEGPAVEFIAFVNTRAQLVDPADVLRDPKRALPNPREALNSPDKLYSMVTGLGEIAALWAKGPDVKKSQEAALLLIRALAHATTDGREYISVGVSTFTSNGGPIKDIIQVVKQHANDPGVKMVVDFLTKALSKKT
jgi:hypothetical protein